MTTFTKLILLCSFLYVQSDMTLNDTDRLERLSNHGIQQRFYEKNTLHNCASEKLIDALANKNPILSQRRQVLEDQYITHVESGVQKSLTDFTLPVVVHIIHDNGEENISDAQVMAGIQHLNDAFANINYYDQGTGVNTGIQFCMALRDPNGDATTAITRDQSSLTTFIIEDQQQELKDINRWNPEEYINIWLVREICSFSSGCNVAGFAFLPFAHGDENDGIVIESQWMGSSEDFSKVLVHEMGHYLGLYHTFRGGCANNECISSGDRVCDTPPDQSTVAVPCNGSANTCDTDVNPLDPNNPFTEDQNDMFWNYMDYGTITCMSAFTNGQSDRMAFYIEGARASLLSSLACLPPCQIPITASFTSNQNEVPLGTTVNFTNTSIGSTDYEWRINGSVFSNTLNTLYNFTEDGEYIIELTTTNSDINCIENYSDTITVFCPVQASFIFNTNQIPVNEVLTLINDSQNGNTLEWTIDGQVQANGNEFSFSLASPGVVQVCIDVEGDYCEDQFCQLINVTEESTNNCEITFYKKLGIEDIPEGAEILKPSSDGGYFIGGFRDDKAMIVKMTPNSEVEWTRTFKFFGYDCGIIDLIQDSDDNLIFIGSCENTTIPFVCKFDYWNDTFEWYKLFPIPSDFNFYKIAEKSPGGNYLIIGENSPDNATAIGCEAFLVEINRDIGNVVFKKNYNLGDCESWKDILIENDNVYLAGHFNAGLDGENYQRNALAQLDFSGNVVWAKQYLYPNLPMSQLFLGSTSDIILDGEQIINLGAVIDTSAITKLSLFVTNMDGNIQWARYYEIPEAQVVFQKTSLVSLPDGYIIYGQYAKNTAVHIRPYLIKIDKEGLIQWAKGFDEQIRQFPGNALLLGDFIYLTGTLGDGSNRDPYLTRMYKDGNLSVACSGINDLEVISTLLSNPYEETVELEDYFPSIAIYDFQDAEGQFANIESEFICGVPYCLEICDNGIDDDLDGYVDWYDSDCFCQDTVACEEYFFNQCEPDCQFFPEIESFDLENQWFNAGGSYTNQSYVADVTGDCIPNIVSAGSELLILDSKTGAVLTTYNTGFENESKLALGDVDEDGMAEIFMVGTQSDITKLYRFDYDPLTNTILQKWESSTSIQSNIASYEMYSTPGLADFDFNNLSEVYVGNQIFNSVDGLELLNTGTGHQGMIQQTGIFSGTSSIGMDLLSEEDCAACSGLELVAGTQVYSVRIASYTNAGLNEIILEKQLVLPDGTSPDGLTRIVDFDRNGTLDVVVATQNNTNDGVHLFVWDVLSETIIGNVFYDLPNAVAQKIAAPAIDDIDDDGWPEIIVSSANALTVLDDYQSGGTVNWGISTNTIKLTTPVNNISGQFIPTLFDINGDGRSELFFKDQNTLNVYDDSLNILSQINCNTLNDATIYPLIVDVNDDQETEIVCPCQGQGIGVFKSIGFPWLEARKIWNQFNYFVANIQDDGVVPAQQQLTHIVADSIQLNGFLTQQSILDATASPINPVPDLMLSIDSSYCDVDSLWIIISICNEGSDTLPALTPISFYFGNPTNINAELTFSDTLGQDLEPGACLEQSYQIAEAANETIYVVGNDNGFAALPYDLGEDFPITHLGECDFYNNIDSVLYEIEEPPVLDLGQDIIICENGVLEFNAGAGFDYYEWQDGSVDSVYTSYDPGVYWVAAWNACSIIQYDTVQVLLDSATVIDLGADMVFCSLDDTLSFSISGFDHYQWYGLDSTMCDTCSSIQVLPDSTVTYSIVASTIAGCISSDSITISVLDTFLVYLDTLICGDTTLLFDGAYLEPGSTTIFEYQSAEGCDSTVIVSVDTEVFEVYYEIIDTSICYGSYIEYDGITIPADSTHIFEYLSVSGCDSILELKVLALDTFYYETLITACPDDTVVIFGNVVTNSGEYNELYQSTNGCDSTEVVRVEFASVLDVDVITEPTCDAPSSGYINVIVEGGQIPYAYDWAHTDENNPELLDLVGGEYVVTISDAFGCSVVSEIALPDLLVLEVTPDTAIHLGCEIELQSLVNRIDSIQYSWSEDPTLSCWDCPDPIASPLQTTTYYLTITDTDGCTTSGSVEVSVIKDRNLYIPNVFSPNDDGLNDVFRIYGGKSVALIKRFEVYNRWGAQVFSAQNFQLDDSNALWDGRFKSRILNPGVFVYLVEVEYLDGAQRIFKGSVTLIE